MSEAKHEQLHQDKTENGQLESKSARDATCGEEEAAAMLARLSKHYGSPVMPISRYCAALDRWIDAIQKLHTACGDRAHGPYAEWWRGSPGVAKESCTHHGAEYVRSLQAIRRDIGKSNFLWRLLYDGEPLRTVPCAVCEGHWARFGLFNDNHDYGPNGCGCEATGWLYPGTVR